MIAGGLENLPKAPSGVLLSTYSRAPSRRELVTSLSSVRDVVRDSRIFVSLEYLAWCLAHREDCCEAFK